MDNEKLTARIELKLKESTFAALKAIHAENKHSPQTVLRGLAEAAEEFYMRHGAFGLPIEIISVNALRFGITEEITTPDTSAEIKSRIADSQQESGRTVSIPDLDKLVNDERSRVVSAASHKAQGRRFQKAVRESVYREEVVPGVTGSAFTTLPGGLQRKPKKKKVLPVF